jgi:20S proteasome alpha/beta subunit
MTIVIGVLCQDGVVLGTDSSVTFAGQIATVEQPGTKLFKVGAQALFAGSGEAGMAQRFLYHAEKFCEGKDLASKDGHFISTGICKKAVEDFANTHAPPGKFCALMAFPSSEGRKLCEFTLTSNLQPEFKTAEMWFATIGSGQHICAPFLGLLRRVFFEGGMPKLQEGVFVTYWALQHAIELNAGGIQGPPRIGIIEKSDAAKGWKARMLTPDDLEEHRSSMEEAEKHIAAFRPILAGRAVRPSPPTTPAPKLSDES